MASSLGMLLMRAHNRNGLLCRIVNQLPHCPHQWKRMSPWHRGKLEKLCRLAVPHQNLQKKPRCPAHKTLLTVIPKWAEVMKLLSMMKRVKASAIALLFPHAKSIRVAGAGA